MSFTSPKSIRTQYLTFNIVILYKIAPVLLQSDSSDKKCAHRGKCFKILFICRSENQTKFNIPFWTCQSSTNRPPHVSIKNNLIYYFEDRQISSKSCPTHTQKKIYQKIKPHLLHLVENRQFSPHLPLFFNEEFKTKFGVRLRKLPMLFKSSPNFLFNYVSELSASCSAKNENIKANLRSLVEDRHFAQDRSLFWKFKWLIAARSAEKIETM